MKTICIIGKPNVGKSTIFNRLIKEKKAIILDTPGVTRDRIYGTLTIQDKSFHLVDTGGITLDKNAFADEVLVQANLAIEDADLILFVVDSQTEISNEDKKVQSILHKSGKPVIVLVNKIDNKQRKDEIYKYFELGFETILPVSGEHNLGFEALQKKIYELLPFEETTADDTLKFCFIGRPNVGKSSLINALLNEKRLIVSDVAGTTRDAIDTKFKYNGSKYTLIDTAGLRKKGKIDEAIEKYSFLRSMKAIDRSDVCILVIDAAKGIIEHDKHIASYAIDSGKAIVLAINKWDLINNPNEKIKEWQEKIKYEFQFMPYMKCVFVSSLTKKRINDLMPEVLNAYNNNHKEIQTSTLNNIIEEAVAVHRPPSYKGKRLRIYYVHQTGITPPKITFEVNNKGLIHFSYARYLENEIRKNIDLDGTPIILQFKNKNEDDLV